MGMKRDPGIRAKQRDNKGAVHQLPKHKELVLQFLGLGELDCRFQSHTSVISLALASFGVASQMPSQFWRTLI